MEVNPKRPQNVALAATYGWVLRQADVRRKARVRDIAYALGTVGRFGAGSCRLPRQRLDCLRAPLMGPRTVSGVSELGAVVQWANPLTGAFCLSSCVRLRVFCSNDEIARTPGARKHVIQIIYNAVVCFPLRAFGRAPLPRYALGTC
eukprot:8870382-Pyramimonas_sp.AAC.1